MAGANGRLGRNGLASYYPAFLDSLYSDQDASTGPNLSPPQTATFVQPPPPAQPLLIELQGDSYVQISGDQPSPAQILDQPHAHANEPARNPTDLHPRQPTLLVFRDGHRLEVSNYTIADGVLYASSDYYRSGAWNQKIDLAALNLDETLEANRSRGLAFRLPSAPNVVIVGP